MDDITKEDLRLYLSRKHKLKVLEEELKAIYESSPKPKEVQGGKSSVRTPSDPTADKARRAGEMRDRIQRQAQELEDMTAAIEDFSTQIDDPIVGAIIRWHYIRGYSWAQTCMKVYGHPNGQAVRMAVNRWFKKREREQSHDNEETNAGAGTEGVHREQTDLQPDSGGSDDNGGGADPQRRVRCVRRYKGAE